MDDVSLILNIFLFTDKLKDMARKVFAFNKREAQGGLEVIKESSTQLLNEIKY